MIRSFRSPLLIFVYLSLNLAANLPAADLQSGEVFADGQSVTGARLNNSVNGAIILPSFISNKTNTAMVDADSVLFYQAGGDALLRSTITLFKASVYASPTFTGNATFSEATVITGTLSPTQIVADTNDYAPTNTATSTTWRLTTDAARSITGISGGITGRILVLHNVGSFNITLADESASSTAANRFALTRDLILMPDQVAMLQYDATSTRWRTFGDRPTINPAFITLTDAATTTLTCDPQKTSQNAKWTIGGNRVLAMSGVTAGMSGELRITQDGTGSRKISLPGPSFTDGVANGTTGFGSVTGLITSTDVGKPISESGSAHITMGVTISSVPTTTIASGSNSAALPQATINVASTTGFAKPGVIMVTTGAGIQAVTCAGSGSSTTFTTCTGGTGTMSTGGAVSQVVLSATASTGTGITFFLPARQSLVLGGGNGMVTLTTTAGALDVLGWSYDGTNYVWGIQKNAN